MAEQELQPRNPNSGPTPAGRPTAHGAVSLTPNVLNARVYSMMCPREAYLSQPAPRHEMRAWDPAADRAAQERRRRDANNLGIAFLGPVLGGPAAFARLAGAPEHVVENFGQLGVNAAGVAGVPGVRGGGRVVNPAPSKPAAALPLGAQRAPLSSRGSGVVVLKAQWNIPQSVRDKIPKSWGDSKPNKKGVGERWQDPNDKGNGVRIDKGNPANSQPTQQVDHVVVRSGGKVIGRDGLPINGPIDQNFSNAHIPLSEYVKWPT